MEREKHHHADQFELVEPEVPWGALQAVTTRILVEVPTWGSGDFQPLRVTAETDRTSYEGRSLTSARDRMERAGGAVKRVTVEIRERGPRLDSPEVAAAQAHPDSDVGFEMYEDLRHARSRSVVISFARDGILNAASRVWIRVEAPTEKDLLAMSVLLKEEWERAMRAPVPAPDPVSTVTAQLESTANVRGTAASASLTRSSDSGHAARRSPATWITQGVVENWVATVVLGLAVLVTIGLMYAAGLFN